MFAAEFEPVETNHRRRAKRAPVSFDSGIGMDADKAARTLCKIVDISAYGARLLTYSALKRGSSIRLTLPTIGVIVADVMWADDFSAGCRFQRPLAPGAFAALAAL